MLRKLPKKNRWWWSFVRRRTSRFGIQEHTAEKWKRRLSYAYLFFAWNAFALVIYMVFTGRKDWPLYYGFKSEEEANLSPGKSWAQTLNIDKARIVRIEQFRKVGTYDWDKEKEDEKKRSKKAELQENNEEELKLN